MVYTHINVYINVYIYIYVCIHILTHIYIQIHIIHIYIYISDTLRTEGIQGMWRGFILGGTRSFVVNGCSMVAYQSVLDLHRNRKP